MSSATIVAVDGGVGFVPGGFTVTFDRGLSYYV